MNESYKALTTAATATELLKRDIVAGVLPPSTRLKMLDLERRYGLGATPLREALVHLAASGLVQAHSQKGFRVSAIDRGDLQDVTRTRQIVEGEALRLALAHGGNDWEDNIVTSYHLMQREQERGAPSGSTWLDRYENRHHQFHQALIAACPLLHLKQICDALYNQGTRYRRVLLNMAGGGPGINIVAHEALMNLILARDPKAPSAIKAHIGSTADALTKLLPD